MQNGTRRLRRFIAALPNHLGKLRARHHPNRGLWLLGAAIFLTSVTIAAIIPRSTELTPANSLALSAPPQTVQLGETILLDKAEDITLPDFAPSEPSKTAHSENDEWTEITVRRGDTLSGILEREGQDSGEVTHVIQSNPEARVFRNLLPGQTLKLRAEPGQSWQELIYETDPGEAFHLVRDTDRIVLTKEIRSFETRIVNVTGSIESSLFEDGQVAGLSDTLIMKLAEIFGWDIDFALDLRRGDSFAVIHETKYWRGQKIADGPIVAAEFINQGKSFRAVAFRDANGYISYYSPEGMSVRRPFLRTPVEFSRITSRFTKGRYHPILKTWRAHKGVDYAAPTGTPIRATASGRVIAIGRRGGYGKRIVIRHNTTYSTVYAHLSRYRNGLRVGSFVEQGQTIGYVGATGLASGPHLHYEFQVNGAHRNPLTYRFPGSTPIAQEHRDAFARLAKTWTARLDLIGHGALATAKR